MVVFGDSYIYYEFISPDLFSGIMEEIYNTITGGIDRNEVSFKNGKAFKIKKYENDENDENLKEETVFLEDGSINTKKYKYGDLYFEKIENSENYNFDFKEYNEGKIRREGFYNFGAGGKTIAEGSKIYDENGKLEIESNFTYEEGSPEKSGEKKYYRENGEIEKIEKFNKGEIIEIIVQN